MTLALLVIPSWGLAIAPFLRSKDAPRGHRLAKGTLRCTYAVPFGRYVHSTVCMYHKAINK